MHSEFIPLAIYVLAVLVLTLWVLVVRNELRLQRFFRGSRVKNLEKVITLMAEEIEALRQKEEAMAAQLTELQERSQKSIQGVSTVRFNPFKGTSGSNQSFATTFLDGEGSGVVLSTLYSRDRVSIFAKPIERGASAYELTEEEQTSLKQARERATKPST